MNTTSDAPPKGSAGLGAIIVLAFVITLPFQLLAAWARPLTPYFQLAPGPLALPTAELRAQRDADVLDAQHDPQGETAEERRRAYHDLNVAEHDLTDSPSESAERVRRLEAATQALFGAEGVEGLRRARAADLERAEDALSSDLPEGDRIAALGGLLRQLQVYGVIRQGVQAAPQFVLRTLFKGRWNAMHRRPLDENLSDVELQAKWGWLALHAEGQDAARRMEALDRYEELGGTRGDRARAAMLLLGGERQAAREALEAAYTRTPTFRLRNLREDLFRD